MSQQMPRAFSKHIFQAPISVAFIADSWNIFLPIPYYPTGQIKDIQAERRWTRDQILPQQPMGIPFQATALTFERPWTQSQKTTSETPQGTYMTG